MIAPVTHTFGDHRPVAGYVDPIGTHYLFEYPNGWQASVVRGPWTHGGAEGLWEVALLDPAGHVSYDVPTMPDVEGHLTRTEVARYLDVVAALPGATP